MNISYCICVGPNFNEEYLDNLILSIKNQYKNYLCDNNYYYRFGYEILLIGDEALLSNFRSQAKILHFDENTRKGWITRKKNLAARYALYETIVIMHDYYLLDKDWFKNFVSFNKVNSNWQLLMNPIQNLEGTRHADWMVHPDRMLDIINLNTEKYTRILMNAAPHENHPKFVNALPYDVTGLENIQYISGGFIMAKRTALLNVPQNEKLAWGDGEDLDWSNRLQKTGYLTKQYYSLNSESLVTLQKPGKWKVTQIPDEFIVYLRLYYMKRDDL